MKNRVYVWVGAVVGLFLVIAAVTPAAAHPLSNAPTSKQGPASPATLPPIPAGLPNYFSFGLSNFDTDWITQSTVPFNLRYQYLSAGVNTGDGWATWNSPPGQFALSYINASHDNNLIPAFVYYQILQSAPNYDEYANLNNAATMRAYYDDFKLLMQKCAQGGGPVFINIEPDLWPTIQNAHANGTDNAANVSTAVASSGQADVAGYPNTFYGFSQALVHLRDLYAPNVSLGLDVSNWATGHDIGTNTDPNLDVATHASRTAAFLNSSGPGFQLLFYSPSDRDAAFNDAWWDDTNATFPNFNRTIDWLGRIVTATQKRALMWQVPVGNRVYRTMNNSEGHYQDNRPEYFLGPQSRTHLQQWAGAGVVGLMFGAGAGCCSHPHDAMGDGITNPAPINGNNQQALVADDDGGYIRLNAAAYYAAGPLALPAAGCGIAFSDVAPTDYFYEPVRYLFCAGAVSGYPDNTFRPYINTTRAQLAKIVILAEGFPINTAGGPHFVDVPTTDTFYSYVETAVNRTLIAGYPCGGPGEPCPGLYYRPSNNITRGQLSKIIVTAEGWPLANPSTATFHDVPVGSTFFSYVETAFAHNLITGYPCGSPGETCPGPYFRTNNSATRGQIAKIVYNAVTAP